MPPSFVLTTTAGLTATTDSVPQTIAALSQHLSDDQAPPGPLGWTITSPWGLVHQGHLILPAPADRSAQIRTHLDDITDQLAREVAQHYRVDQD